MIKPKTTIERELLSGNSEIIIGVDEVGRGPLAGPVVAAAAWVHPDLLDAEFEKRELIRDSKTLSEKQRIEICERIHQNDGFEFGVGEVSHHMVDRINVLNATFLAMRLAFEEVLEKVSWKKKVTQKNVCLLVDGNKKVPKVPFDQRVFAKGDERIFSISVASIVAKVHRDTLMRKYHEKFPEYGFDKHKGYGTKLHMEQLQKNGPCDIHRKSFGPVRDCLSED